jgi:cobalamin biosynthesis protein CobD/CbiB
MAYALALALAAALIDVTLGYPGWLARAIGAPTQWLASWLRIVKTAAEGLNRRAALALYLAPVAVAALAIMQLTPPGPLGFAAMALLTSTFCGRQSLDARGREVASAWEEQGPYEALAAAEALGADEAEPRLARAVAASIAARFADEVAASTVFILIGGLAGAALCRALTLAGRLCRESRDDSAFARAVAALEGWTITAPARSGALWLALAAASSGRRSAFAAVVAEAPRPGAPAEQAMLRALGDIRRDEPGYVRSALALFRRAAAAELATLAVAALAAVAWG